jgi:hypothetical protein
MNSNIFKKGDILLATHREIRKGYHPIVYLAGYSDESFIGAMLTHHADTIRNLKLDSSFFENKVEFENTFLVIGKFLKSEEWGPFKKINELTPEGLNFVEKVLIDKPEETFANYFRRHLT